MNLFVEMNNLADHFFKDYHEFVTKVIEEDDWFLSWRKFHKLHPEIDKWEWEAKQKELQEV